jgi:hypothetical protein
MMLNIAGSDSWDLGRTGVFTIPLKNNSPYTVTLQGETGNGQGSPTEPLVVMPKEDPDPPSGFIQMQGGMTKTISINVTLRVNASDELLDGIASPGLAASISNDYTALNQASGVTEMRFSNNPDTGWTAWEPYSEHKQWILNPLCKMNQLCPVFAQFKDGAGNESMIVFDEILYQPLVMFLPMVVR